MNNAALSQCITEVGSDNRHEINLILHFSSQNIAPSTTITLRYCSMATEHKTSTAIAEQPCYPEYGEPSASANVYPSVRDEEAPQSVFSIIEPPAQHSTVTTHILDPVPNDIFPDGGLRSWSVIMGSFLLLMSTYGLMNATGVLQSYFATHQLSSYSTSAVGWIPGVFLFFGLGLSAQVGSMFDRYGPTWILITGTGCYVAGLLLLAECRLYWHFILTMGVLTGTGSALLSTVALAAVPHWFDRRVGLAMGTAMAGGGAGGVVFPLILRAGFTNLGYRWTIRMLALIIGVLCGVAILLVRSRLPKGRSQSTINLGAFKDTRFTWLTLGTFSKCN